MTATIDGPAADVINDKHGSTLPDHQPESDECNQLPAGEAAPQATTVEEATAVVDAARQADVPIELLFVDPKTLILGSNVRTNLRLPKSFVGSIKDLGVLQPITARRTDEGLRVVYGARRTLAAIEAHRDTVPVIAVTAPDDEKAAEVLRIIEQLAENKHRDDISDADEVGAHQGLLDLGLTASQIGRRTHTPRKRVDATLKVATSKLAAAAMSRYELDLPTAAAISEFDDDPDMFKALTVAAKQDPGRFPHILQQAKDARVAAAARTEALQQLTATGVQVIDAPDTLWGGPVRRLTDLRATPDTEPGDVLSLEEHRVCPGHAAYLDQTSHWSRGKSIKEFLTVFVCTDWLKHGHADLYATPGKVSTEVANTLHTSRGPGSMSDAQKTERRTVIANNKAWDSAEKVRRNWLRQFLARRTPPKDAQRWIATTLGEGSHRIRSGLESNRLAAKLLGIDWPQHYYRGSGPHPVAAATATASPGRATMITLGVLLAALEASTSRNTWRNPAPEERAYFTTIRDWGYTLSDVEGLVVASGEDDDSDQDGHQNESTDTPQEPDGSEDSSGPAPHTADDQTIHDASPGDPVTPVEPGHLDEPIEPAA